MKLTINEGLKRFFVETNAYEVCADVDGDTSKIFNFDEDEYENVTEF